MPVWWRNWPIMRWVFFFICFHSTERNQWTSCSVSLTEIWIRYRTKKNCITNNFIMVWFFVCLSRAHNIYFWCWADVFWSVCMCFVAVVVVCIDCQRMNIWWYSHFDLSFMRWIICEIWMTSVVAKAQKIKTFKIQQKTHLSEC